MQINAVNNLSTNTLHNKIFKKVGLAVLALSSALMLANCSKSKDSFEKTAPVPAEKQEEEHRSFKEMYGLSRLEFGVFVSMLVGGAAMAFSNIMNYKQDNEKPKG